MLLSITNTDNFSRGTLGNFQLCSPDLTGCDLWTSLQGSLTVRACRLQATALAKVLFSFTDSAGIVNITNGLLAIVYDHCNLRLRHELTELIMHRKNT